MILGIGMVDVLNNNNKQGQSSEEDDVEIAEEQTGKQADDEFCLSCVVHVHTHAVTCT